MPTVGDGINLSTITLLTDFGAGSPYLGIMKGVMLSVNSQVKVVDLTHDIPQGDIDAAAFVLYQSYSFFPRGTINTIVVDPGVGTDRRILAVQASDYYFIAPDNGVLKYIYDRHSNVKVISLTESTYWLPEISTTFHGRDIFAPVAANLSMGIALRCFGQTITDYDRGELYKPKKEKNTIKGRIEYIDGFGNCISNIPADMINLNNVQNLQFKKKKFSEIKTTYGNVKTGEPLVLVGSHKHLEIAVRNGNASEELGVTKGDELIVKLKAM